MLFILQSTLWRQIIWKKLNSLIYEYAICNEISRFLVSSSFFSFKNLQKFIFFSLSFSLWFRKFADLISVWVPFSLTVMILSERLKAFLQIKQSLMVGRLHEMHVSERSKINWFFEKIRLFCLIVLDKIWKTIIRRELRYTHSTVGRWKKRAIFRQAPGTARATDCYELPTMRATFRRYGK